MIDVWQHHSGVAIFTFPYSAPPHGFSVWLICPCSTLCIGRSSVYFCSYSPQNLAVPNNIFISFSVSLWEYLCDFVFDGVRLEGKCLLLLLLLLKKIGNARPRGRLPPYQSEDPSLTVPTYRGKKRKGNQLETKK